MDNLLSNYINCYSGYATDENIRYNASSGGVITALLVFALEKGLINGAIVARSDKNNSLAGELFIARTKEEIIAASQSKYCPVSANVVLKEIMALDKLDKLAMVGLPCHIASIKQVAKINPEIDKKIILYLGLFCGGGANIEGLKFFLDKNKIKEKEISKINFRGSGWPGLVVIKKKNEKILSYSFPSYWNIAGSYIFYPRTCTNCSDCVSALSDLSFGDAWLKEFENDNIGRSLIICRTEKGKDILKFAQESMVLELEPISSEKVIKSQMFNLYLKKKGLKSLSATKDLKGLNPDLIDRFLALFFLLNSSIGKNKFLKKILYFIPLKIISLQNTFFSSIYFKKAGHDFKKYKKI